MASKITLKNLEQAEFTIQHPDGVGAGTIKSTDITYKIDTVDDFASVPSIFDTVIVKDKDRGGVFNKIASTTANDGTIFDGNGCSWERQYSGAVNVKWFISPDDASDDIGIQKAIDSSYKIYIPESTYSIKNMITVKEEVAVSGCGKSTILQLNSDSVAFKMLTYSKLEAVSVEANVVHTLNGIEVGSSTESGGRVILENIVVSGMGNDGVSIINGNVGTLSDVISINNGRDGVNFTTDTSDNNGWRLQGFIDVRSNTRDGLHIAMGTSKGDIEAPKSISANYIVAQENGRYGVYIGSRSNVLTIYSEANTTNDLFLDTYASGNLIETLEIASIVDNGTGNLFNHHNIDANYTRGFLDKVNLSGGEGKGLKINSNDGTAGYLDIEKPSIREYHFTAGGSSATQNIRWLNGVESYRLDHWFGGNARPNSDSAYDIGATSYKWRSVYSDQIGIQDGIVPPSQSVGTAFIYIDNADGDLKIKFGDGTIKTIMLDT